MIFISKNGPSNIYWSPALVEDNLLNEIKLVDIQYKYVIIPYWILCYVDNFQ